MNSSFHHDTILVDKHVVVDLVAHIHIQEDMQYKIFVHNSLHMNSMDTMNSVNPETMNTFLDGKEWAIDLPVDIHYPIILN